MINSIIYWTLLILGISIFIAIMTTIYMLLEPKKIRDIELYNLEHIFKSGRLKRVPKMSKSENLTFFVKTDIVITIFIGICFWILLMINHNGMPQSIKTSVIFCLIFASVIYPIMYLEHKN